VLSRASLYVAGQLRNSLDFQDPQNQLQPSLGTPNDIFLVQFIFSCIERGLYNCIVTSKMTLTAEVVMLVGRVGAGSNRKKSMHLVLHALKSSLRPRKELKAERLGRSIRERVATNALFWNMSHLEKLEEFCGLVERDCLGMLLVFSLLGRPMDIRRVMLRSLTTWHNFHCIHLKTSLTEPCLNKLRMLPVFALCSVLHCVIYEECCYVCYCHRVVRKVQNMHYMHNQHISIVIVNRLWIDHGVNQLI
uniref:Uncharacterized protein n=1 Tax=Oncorhynchus tshawytscha TaxID=74940 RepID=A0A8C8MDU6_ONCTS